MPVVVVGPLAFDDVRTSAEERSGQLGGSGAYASVAAAKFAPTALVSVAGDDLTEEDLAPLLAAGVDLGGLERRTGRTLRWSGTHAAISSEVRNTDLGVVSGWTPRIPRAWLDTPYVLLANTDPAAQAAALAQLRPALAVLDTMEEWISAHRRGLEDVIAGVGVVAVNERELATLTRRKGAKALLARGPRAVIVKRGPGGATLVTSAGSLDVPAHPAHAFDPTGAGDALVHGMAAASFAIGSFSVRALSRATREEIETRARWLGARARLGTDQHARLYEGR